MTARKKAKQKNSEGTLNSNAIKAPPDAVVETTAETDTLSHSQEGFPIVGIGASAGGLAAFEAFFSGMPAVIDPGLVDYELPPAEMPAQLIAYE